MLTFKYTTYYQIAYVHRKFHKNRYIPFPIARAEDDAILRTWTNLNVKARQGYGIESHRGLLIVLRSKTAARISQNESSAC